MVEEPARNLGSARLDLCSLYRAAKLLGGCTPNESILLAVAGQGPNASCPPISRAASKKLENDVIITCADRQTAATAAQFPGVDDWSADLVRAAVVHCRRFEADDRRGAIAYRDPKTINGGNEPHWQRRNGCQRRATGVHGSVFKRRKRAKKNNT